jgi:hypothetical protein
LKTEKLWKIKLFSFFFLLVSNSYAWDFRGYVKAFAESFSSPQDNSFIGGDYWAEFISTRFSFLGDFNQNFSAEASYQLVPFYGRTFIALYNVRNINLKSYRAYDLNLFLVDPDETKKNSFSIVQNLDRLFFTYSDEKFIATLGRQIVTFGSAKIVNPTDVVTPFGLNTIDTEERPGSDAARLKYFISQFSLEGGFLAGHHFDSDLNAWFVRFNGNFQKHDAYLMLMDFRGNNQLLGFNWEGNISGATGWAEGSYVTGDKNYFRFSTGLQYFFVGQWTLFGEYHFNGIGAYNKNDYLKVLTSPSFIAANLFLVGKDYFSVFLNKEISPLLKGGIGSTANLHDWSTLVNLNFEWNFSTNNYLTFTYFNGFGPTGTEFSAYPANLIFEYRLYY